MFKKIFRRSRNSDGGNRGGSKDSEETESANAPNGTSSPPVLNSGIDAVPKRIVLSAKDEREMFEKRLAVARGDARSYAYSGADASQAKKHLDELPVVFEFNCRRLLQIFLLDLDFLDERWWPQINADVESGRARRGGTVVEPDKRTLDYETSLNVLEQIDHGEVMDILRKLKSKHEDCPMTHPFLTDLANDAHERINEAFDQYTGLRQIGDLRGLPEGGAELHQLGTQCVQSLFEATVATIAWIFCVIHDDVLRHEGTQAVLCGVEAALPKLFTSLLDEYTQFLDEILLRLGVKSSKREIYPGTGDTYNEHYKEVLIQDVIEVTSKHEKLVRERCEAIVNKIEGQCPVGVRTDLLGSIGGAKPWLASVDEQLAELRPWAVNWLKVQKDSFALREVFAHDAGGLTERLQASREQAVKGFESCLESWVVAPLIEIGETLERLEGAFAKYQRGDD